VSLEEAHVIFCKERRRWEDLAQHLSGRA
jgi:hypothetical protein